MASRFSFGGTTPPGHHDNVDAGNVTGNPDIRVPEGIERVNGLRAGSAEKKENADRGARAGDERPEDPGRRRNVGETRETSDQDQLEVQRRPEGRELRDVADPGYNERRR
ncbi:hypothetical protein NDU88_003548 [Pleurodeles waltl]|uniref:Uncharacterized protein n=1 Tax=Pleurodeles waltl TaxID=8319 RepID=A0AAV7W2R7_PLEWA|nr:hypothetical protein NDU88_003548 [Pleurodeles waltl]